jgi:Ca2+-binding RTX toxin-like protein
MAIDLETLTSGDGSQGFVLQGESAGDQSGFSVASAGDLNGDGFDDLIVGAPRADGPADGRNYAGDSYVIFGKAGGFAATIDLATLTSGDGSQGFVLQGEGVFEQSGASVAWAGDINGDGFGDLIVGARYAGGPADGRPGAGDSYVIFGKAGGFGAAIDLATITTGDGSQGFVLQGELAVDLSGWSVASAGDANGDGFDDLIVGAPRADGPADGRNYAGDSYVIFGKAGGFGATIDLATLTSGDGSQGFVLQGESSDDRSGFSVASAGDVNGDGFGDLIVGAPYADGPADGRDGAGDSYVIFGKAGGFGAAIDLATLTSGDGSQGFVLHGESANDTSGFSVASAGDVNGDGFDDLIVGARAADGPADGRNYAGDSYVIFGKAGGFGAAIDLATLTSGDGSQGFVLHGESANDTSGFSVASAGDVNGDGFDDLIVGAPRAYGPADGRPYAGDSYVIFGKAGGFGATIDLATIAAGTGGFVLQGESAFDLSGTSVAAAGDVNGDGFDDLIVGARAAAGPADGRSYAGESYVIFGSATIGGSTSAVTRAGTDASETLNGNGAANVMIGGRGDDILNGNGGADVLRGGEGDDVLSIADARFRTLSGGTGEDVLELDGAMTLADAAFRRVDGIEGITLGDFALNLTLGRVASHAFDGLAADGFRLVVDASAVANAAITLNGSAFGRALTVDLSGNAAVSRLSGGIGDDVLTGGSANDKLSGGDGVDTLGGGTGNDKLKGDGGADMLQGGEGADVLQGGDGVDTLEGGEGADVLQGGDGVDTLEGGAGGDSLRGGSGADLFVFASLADSGTTPATCDMILDFVQGEDTIDLSGIDAVTGGGHDAFSFIGTGAFSGTAGELRAVAAGTNTLVSADVNGDAVADFSLLLKGTHVLQGSDFGVPDVVPRRELDLATITSGDGSQGFVLQGEGAGDQSGRSVASAGDVNGDGFDDLIVGAPYADGPADARNYAGDSYVIFGKAGGFGTTIDLATITSGDGSQGFVLQGESSNDRSGFSVASAGDVNGDGFDDLIVGARFADGPADGRPDAGDSYVIFGKAGGFGATIDLATLTSGDGSQGFVLQGESAVDFSGWSVASAGDVNGDGFDDLIVGARNAAGPADGRPFAGDSYVIFGKAGGFAATIDLATLASGDGSQGFVLQGELAYDLSGWSVASAGDVNGDGFDDLIVGALSGDGPADGRGTAGDSYVIFGKAGGFGATIDLATITSGDGSQGFVLQGESAFDGSGASAASAGDVNGDGFDDLIVGAPYADGPADGRNYAGDSYVIFGKAGGFGAAIDLATITSGDGSQGFVLQGESANDTSGFSVASAGDVNGDGFDDLIVGAPFADGPADGRDGAGDSYVIFGNAGGFGATIDLATIAAGTGGFVLQGESSDDRSGFSVAAAGDVNGDGFDDLIVGAPYADGPADGRPLAGDSYVIFGSATIGGSTSAVTRAGTDASETLNGNGAANVMVGGRGDDILNGNGGADVLRGGEGDDVLSIGNAQFQALSGGTGEDVLELDGAMTLADAAFRRVDGIEGIALGDFALNLTLGRVASHAFDGLAADGFRLVVDTSAVANAAITLNGSAFGRALTVDLSGNAAVSRLSGGIGDDVLTGGSANDQLNGGDGADRLEGGLGGDYLRGGSGADVLVFASLADSGTTPATRDVILDFGQGEDTIDLSGIDAVTGGGHDAFSFIGTGAFSGTAGELRAVAAGNNTLVSADVNGDAVADLSLLLHGRHVLQGGDFVL